MGILLGQKTEMLIKNNQDWVWKIQKKTYKGKMRKWDERNGEKESMKTYVERAFYN